MGALTTQNAISLCLLLPLENIYQKRNVVMNIKENQRYKAIGNILQPEGVNSILMAYVEYNRFFDLAIDLLNMPIDYHPIENGCILRTGAELRTIIVGGKIISGQC